MPSLQIAIKQNRETIFQDGPRNESQTRYSLVDRILCGAGRRIHDLDDVQTEIQTYYKIDGGYKYVDYFLGTDKYPVIIEAKGFDGHVEESCVRNLKDNDLEQLYDYVRFGLRLRSGYSILTDGNQWEVYNNKLWKAPNSRGPKLWRKSKLDFVCLICNPVDQSAKTLHKYLKPRRRRRRQAKQFHETPMGRRDGQLALPV